MENDFIQGHHSNGIKERRPLIKSLYPFTNPISTKKGCLNKTAFFKHQVNPQLKQ